MRARFDALLEAGELRASRRHDRLVWELTDSGRRRLARARQRGQRLVLPEAPQHREWRLARARAGEDILRLRVQLAEALGQAQGLLESDISSSEEWPSLAGCLQSGGSGLATAVYRLREWPEREDGHADLARRCAVEFGVGARATRLAGGTARA